MIDRRRVILKHPLAHELSIVSGLGTYGDGENTFEIALITEEAEFLTTEVPEFAGHFDGSIYSYVPREKINAFLETYGHLYPLN